MINTVKTIDKNRKLLLSLGIAGAVFISGLISFPYIQTAYKKHQATELVAHTDKSISELERTVQAARDSLDANRFLMTGQLEVLPYQNEINDSSDKLTQLQEQKKKADADLAARKYDTVREQLDETFGLKDGKRLTPIIVAGQETNDLRDRVLLRITERRTTRDDVVNHECYLLATLKKPLVPGLLEKPSELSTLPDQFYRMIPLRTPELEQGLLWVSAEYGIKGIDKRLLNRMGASLADALKYRNHIAKLGLTQRIRDAGTNMYARAHDEFILVQGLNDSLSVWYRPDQHDGKYQLEDHQKLRDEQNRAIEHVQFGDQQLNALKAYFAKLHEQEIVYVSEQMSRPTTFTHYRTRHRTAYKTVTTYDSSGHAHSHQESYDQTYQESYHTDGKKFYFVLTTETPNGRQSQDVYVGEKDSHDTWFSNLSWDYHSDERVGYVRKWKRLHDDDSGILSGINRTEARIEQCMER